jgi:peroxiredoxin
MTTQPSKTGSLRKPASLGNLRGKTALLPLKTVYFGIKNAFPVLCQNPPGPTCDKPAAIQRKPRLRPVLTALLALCVAAPATAAPAETAETSRPPLKDPSILLLGDDAVHAELNLAPDDSAAVNALLREHNDLLLAIRDTSANHADTSLRPSIDELRDKLKQALSKPQQERLGNLVLQAQGYDALTRDDVAAKLGLTSDQRSRIAQIMDDFWTASTDLQKQKKDQSPQELESELKKLQADRQRHVVAELDAKQEHTWGKMLGAPFDFARVRASPAWAPEFEGVDEWINSPPRTIESLRGQVVVVHFFAFGCINCIHNYPWYREWQTELDGQGVKIIGIHTPETKKEADNDALKKSLAEHELTFAVAVDKSKANWNAWHNTIWPSVYLVDKQGRLRYWWYGELDWQGAGGHKVARQKIDELLAEPDHQTAP